MKSILILLLALSSSLAYSQNYSVTFQVNMVNLGTIGTDISIAGNFQAAAGYPADWTPGSTLLVDANQDSIYAVTVQIPAGSYEFRYLNGVSWGTDESVPGTCAINGNRGLTVTTDTILDAVCFGTCTICACNTTYANDSVTACGSYEWIDGVTYTTSNNTATHTLVNATGCDSVVFLDLTVEPLPNTSVTQVGSTLTADESGAVYQWLDCNNSYALLTGETSQSYTPSITGNYAVEISLSSCVDTSLCTIIDFTGIGELNQGDKKAVRYIDFMGREIKFEPNTPLIIIYSDGTRERILSIEE